VPTKALSEVARFLRTERIGGLVLLSATALALIVANSPLRDAYHRLSGTVIGPAALHLDLTVERWATDGLLAFFFVVAGLELKRELFLGELRDPRRAMLPIFGAVGGMVTPVLVFLAVGAGAPGAGDLWAVPVATDIAFALAVLAVAGRDLPSGLRAFLLTLAIVDDLGAIVLIAVLFTSHLTWPPLLGAVAAVGAYWLLQRTRLRGRFAVVALYGPLGVAAWGLLHASGVHATVAGVLVGLATRVHCGVGEDESPAEALEHRLQPFSSGVCVPLFAFFAAGVPLSARVLTTMINDRVAVAVTAGLVVGKSIGVLGGAALTVRLGLARLPRGLGWRDMAAVSVLTGCGFTVSLLIAELAADDAAGAERIKLAVLTGSLVAAVLGALLLRRQSRLRSP
jgi:NhaA family Na+:H+ antiporter